MGHHHHHHHAIDTRGALSLALILNAVFLVAETAAGLWTGSLALLSDAAHMLSDVGALVLALAAAQLAQRAASASMTFGLARAEVLGAFLNGLFLLVACGWIAVEALERLSGTPPPVPGMPVLIVGALGLAINVGSAVVLARSDRDNLNIRGALVHMIADALGSVGAMVAAGFLMAGFPSADAVVSVLVAALVAYSGIALVRDAARVLMQLPPPELDVGEVRDGLASVDGVAQVHDLHAWSLDGKHAIVSAHLVLDQASGQEAVCAAAHTLLRERFDIVHATLQAERGNSCAVSKCGVVSDVA